MASTQKECTIIAPHSRKSKRRLGTHHHHSFKSSCSSSCSTSTRESTVLVSPRLLPFPYHNDSLFLPTAEHPSVSIATCRSYSSFSSPRPPPPPPRRQASAPPILSKRRNVVEHHHTRTAKDPSSYQTRTPSWLRKIWKSMKRPSWQFGLSSSTKAIVSILS